MSLLSSLAFTPGRVSPLLPPMLGTWQAGQVWAVDRKTGRMHVDHSVITPDLSDNNLMPYGQRIEFTNGYDKLSKVAYWQAFWLLPLPPNSCRYPFLQYQCDEGTSIPRPNQTPKQLEFTITLEPKAIEHFFPVGATKTERVYFLRCGGNDEWVPLLYVSKDRQRMWCFVGVDDCENCYGLQEYHCVSGYKPRH